MSEFTPWVEKYRPKKLDEIIGHEEIIKRLKAYVQKKTIPNMIFAGPAGTGKTTAALCLARELFGEYFDENFLELNASVSKDTPILIREREKLYLTTFENLDKRFFKDNDSGSVELNDIEVLTVDKTTLKLSWKKPKLLIRHRVDYIKVLTLEDGSKLELTGNHSIMVFGKYGLVTKKASEIEKGDYLISISRKALIKRSDLNTIVSRMDANFACDGGASVLSSYSRFEDKLPVAILKELNINISENFKEISKDSLNFIKHQISNTCIKIFLDIVSKSDLTSIKVVKTEIKPYRGYVYDISVPGNEMFFAGTTPILLHNSDARGIDVVRNKIKEFARIAPIGDVPFKIIFLDEASEMTADAQQALRRIMEKYSDITRFILSCNYLSRLIDPIQSRCVIFKFSQLKDEDIRKKLEQIAKAEGLTLKEDGIKAILYVCEGDMRKAINILQAAAAIDNTVTAESVYKVVSIAKPEDVRQMLEHCLSKSFEKAREKLHEIFLEYGVSAEDVIKQIYKEVLKLNIDERKKVDIIDKLGEYDYRITIGAHPIIQLEAFLAWLCNYV